MVVEQQEDGGVKHPPLLMITWDYNERVEPVINEHGFTGVFVPLAVAAQVKTLVAEFQRGFSKHRRGGRACEVCGAHCDDRSPTCKRCSPRRRGHTDEAAKAD